MNKMNKKEKIVFDKLKDDYGFLKSEYRSLLLDYFALKIRLLRKLMNDVNSQNLNEELLISRK